MNRSQLLLCLLVSVSLFCGDSAPASAARKNLKLFVGQTRVLKVGWLRSVRTSNRNTVTMTILRGGKIRIRAVHPGTARIFLRRRKASRLTINLRVTQPPLKRLLIARRGEKRIVPGKAKEAWSQDPGIVRVKVVKGRARLEMRRRGAALVKVRRPSGMVQGFIVGAGVKKLTRVEIRVGQRKSIPIAGLRRASARFPQLLKVRRLRRRRRTYLWLKGRRKGACFVGLFDRKRRLMGAVMVIVK